MSHKRIIADRLPYRLLNQQIKQAVQQGFQRIDVEKVNGQRYIAIGLKDGVKIRIHGTPGNDLAAFVNGAEVTVYGNAQDCICNTMNSGKIVIHGHAGDLVGYAMRGGQVFIRDDVGYRVGIHMKAYKNQIPMIAVGGKALDFFGEYMAGGILVLLGLNLRKGDTIVGDYTGTGMHGGVIYVRNEVPMHNLGKEVRVEPTDDNDRSLLKKHLKLFAKEFNYELREIMDAEFSKLVPVNSRPYGGKYAY